MYKVQIEEGKLPVACSFDVFVLRGTAKKICQSVKHRCRGTVFAHFNMASMHMAEV